jgi:hypothetical protein
LRKIPGIIHNFLSNLNGVKEELSLKSVLENQPRFEWGPHKKVVYLFLSTNMAKKITFKLGTFLAELLKW